MQTLSQQNYRLIHDLYVWLDASDCTVLDQFDLTPSQFRVLTLIAQREEMRLVDLSDAMLVARSTITRIVDLLEQRSLVQRLDDPVDRRTQRLVLTPDGRACWHNARTAHEQVVANHFELLSEPEQQSLRHLLTHLRDHLASQLGSQ